MKIITSSIYDETYHVDLDQYVYTYEHAGLKVNVNAMMHSIFRQLPGFETAAFEKFACGRNPKLKTECQALLFDFALLNQTIGAADGDQIKSTRLQSTRMLPSFPSGYRAPRVGWRALVLSRPTSACAHTWSAVYTDAVKYISLSCVKSVLMSIATAHAVWILESFIHEFEITLYTHAPRSYSYSERQSISISATRSRNTVIVNVRQ